LGTIEEAGKHATLILMFKVKFFSFIAMMRNFIIIAKELISINFFLSLFATAFLSPVNIFIQQQGPYQNKKQKSVNLENEK
jgi:hypothetical protein